ncbi:MAG: hypothetical protein K8S94_07405 [Planctomycetia bacterium]|nr:hypothetical protein [Planctomycetia bacterium]
MLGQCLRRDKRFVVLLNDEMGEPPKLVLTACMRKLLVILNAMLRTGESWGPRLATVTE